MVDGLFCFPQVRVRVGGDPGLPERGGEVRRARAADHGSRAAGGSFGLRGAEAAGGLVPVLRPHALLPAAGDRRCVMLPPPLLSLRQLLLLLLLLLRPHAFRPQWAIDGVC